MRSIVTAVLLTLAVNGAQAAEAVREPMELSESGRAYLEAISGRGIVSDVAYYDPFAPAPELKISAAPTEKPKVERGSGFSIQLVMDRVVRPRASERQAPQSPQRYRNGGLARHRRQSRCR